MTAIGLSLIMRVGKMVKLIVERHLWESSTANRNWTIAKYDDGTFSCSCPAWIFQKGGIRKDCKHIKAFIESTNQREQYTTAIIQGCDKEIEEVKKCDTMGGIEIVWAK